MSVEANIGNGMSFKTAALIAGTGLLLMAVCAPPAYFHFLPQGEVDGDAAATVAALQASGGQAYLIGGFLLFFTYCLDILVAWALYWLIRPGQAAMAQLVAWSRLVYAALAFVGLSFTFQAYDLAASPDLTEAVGEYAVQNQVLAKLYDASSATAFALFFFGVHLAVLAVAIVRSQRIPTWLAVLIGLAGLSYIVMHVQPYFAPELSVGWMLLLALGELVFMLWLLITGLRMKSEEG